LICYNDKLQINIQEINRKQLSSAASHFGAPSMGDSLTVKVRYGAW